MRTNLLSMNIGMWITAILLFGNRELTRFFDDPEKGQMATWGFLVLTAAMSVGLLVSYLRSSNKNKTEQSDK